MTRGARLWSPDTGGDGNGGTEPTTPPPAGEGSQADKVLQAFERLLERSKGDGVALAQQLYRENFEYRDELRRFKEKAPPEGALVLTGEAATLHQQYAALGRRPDEVAQALAELDTLRTQAQQRARLDLVTQAATAAELEAAVLAKLAPADLEIVVKDEQKAGKPAKAAYVVAEGKETPLLAYAEKAWPEFMPALRKAPARPALGTPQIPTQPPNGQPRQPARDERPLVNF
jgi:hypothetical protein